MEAAESAHLLYVLEPMFEGDLSAVIAIEEESFSNPWTRESFLHEINKNPYSLPKVARTTDERAEVAGYCVNWRVFEHFHVQNIAVHPRHRGKGLGRYMMEQTLNEAREAGALDATLEVRESNTSAQKLYVSLGFKEAGKRRNYYSRPREDAILYRKDLAR
jgi:ribosomal-protein-alanine N-acetyltransferase